jgi:hypothetical protein
MLILIVIALLLATLFAIKYKTDRPLTAPKSYINKLGTKPRSSNF